MEKIICVFALLLVMAMTATACGGNGNSKDTSVHSSESMEESDVNTNHSESDSEAISSEDSQPGTTENISQDSEIVSSEVVSESEPVEKETSTNAPTEDEATQDEPSKDEPSKDEPSQNKPSQNEQSGTKEAEAIKKAVNSVVKSNMSDIEKVLVIHDYITYNVDYDYENYLNNTIPYTSYTAYGALTTGRAVCSGYAYLFWEMAKVAGLEVEYVEGTANNGSGKYVGHAWNQVKVDDKWYNLDSCWDDGTWAGKESDDHSANSYSYCLVSDDVLYKDHKTNNNSVHKCDKHYDAAIMAKTLAKVNTYKDMVYAESAAKIEDAMKTMVDAGKTSFSIVMADDGNDHWEQISVAIAKLKQPLWVQSSTSSRSFAEYRIEKKENVYIVNSAKELKQAIEAYKNKLNQLEVWYYDSELTNDNASRIVNDALYNTGYNVELLDSTDVFGGKIQCHIREVDNVLRITDMSEAVTYLKENGADVLKSKYIWYPTKNIGSGGFADELCVPFVKAGYSVAYSEVFGHYTEVVKFKITEVREVTYISDAQALRNYVESIGYTNLVGKKFNVIGNGENEVDVVYNMFTEAQYAADFTLSCWGHVIGVEVTDIFANVYISANEAELKADILEAIDQGVIENAEFRLLDKTGSYSSEDIKAMIDSMNIGLVMDLMWYNDSRHYHSIGGARFI